MPTSVGRANRRAHLRETRPTVKDQDRSPDERPLAVTGAADPADEDTCAAIERAKDDFVALASHELKAPLTSVIGYAQLLLRRVRQPDPDLDMIALGLADINENAQALNRLLDELLDVSRIQTGSVDLRRAPCRIGDCLATVLRRLAPDERARVEVTLPTESPVGQWDRQRVEQVLTNLIGNALRYSPAEQRVRVAIAPHRDGIEVTVADQGFGIAADDLPRLFERFYRTTPAREGGVPGTGLGLYICRGIVEAHGGRIRAESPGEGRGATFRFTLPHHLQRTDAPPTGREGDG
jgi:signal transduction histidine kinase